MTTKLFRAAKSAKNSSDSEYGWTFTFLTVGPKPSRSTARVGRNRYCAACSNRHILIPPRFRPPNFPDKRLLQPIHGMSSTANLQPV